MSLENADIESVESILYSLLNTKQFCKIESTSNTATLNFIEETPVCTLAQIACCDNAEVSVLSDVMKLNIGNGLESLNQSLNVANIGCSAICENINSTSTSNASKSKRRKKKPKPIQVVQKDEKVNTSIAVNKDRNIIVKEAIKVCTPPVYLPYAAPHEDDLKLLHYYRQQGLSNTLELDNKCVLMVSK